MGLFDLFKRGGREADAPAPVVATGSVVKPKQAVTRVYAPGGGTDMANNDTLAELFRVPQEERRAGWTDSFFRALWRAPLVVPQARAFTGPDGFPYLHMCLPEKNKPYQSHSLAGEAMMLLDQGVGIALFDSPDKSFLQYVMQVGQIDCLVRYDHWLGDPQDCEEGAARRAAAKVAPGLEAITTEKQQEVLIGSPSEALLPSYTARALEKHMREQWHMEEPRVALMVNHGMAPSRNLVIGRKLSDFADPETAGEEARALRWYLPPQRGLMLQPDMMTLEEMRPLTDFFPKENNGD